MISKVPMILIVTTILCILHDFNGTQVFRPNYIYILRIIEVNTFETVLYESLFPSIIQASKKWSVN